MSVLVLAPPSSASSPADGPMLYTGSRGHLATAAGQATDLAFPVSSPAAFSPDGALIASASTRCADESCQQDSTVITVRGADGSSTPLAAIPGDAEDLAWSPDQTQLAVITGFNDSVIWRVSLDGSAPEQVLGSTDSFRVESNGLDWDPSAERIAFVGTPLNSDGSSLAVDTDQLYTVASGGGSPVKYSKQTVCEFPSCQELAYSSPEFSPSGDSIGAFVHESNENFETDTQVEDEYLGVVGPGATPIRVRSLLHLVNPSEWTYLATRGPVWSSDGSRLLYAQYQDDSLSTTVARVVPVSSGATEPVADPDFEDWQPCPTGVCVSWAPSPDECTVRGTDGDDRLVGTAGADVICGYGGNDTLIGSGGNDTLLGGDGEDDLAGGPGADSLDGGADSDSLRGDTGNDLLVGGPQVDLVTYFNARTPVKIDLGRQQAAAGPQGKDRLIGIEGAFGSKTGDVIIGSSSSNHLFGGPGDDVIKGMGGTDTLNGDAGVDRLLGGGAADLLQGDDNRDHLDGGPAADACYDEVATRTSCELGTEKPPKRGTAPKDGPDTGVVPPGGGRAFTRAVAGGGLMTYWNIGHDDFLTVYDATATQNIGSWVNTPSWESQVCRFVRFSPARGACSAVGALNAISKYQMKWFLWNAKKNGGCAIGILDWGRNGINQFKKRWKTRTANYDNGVAIPYLSPGRVTNVKVGSGSVPARC